MTADELVTKADLEAMEYRIVSMLRKMTRPEEKKMLSLDEACEYLGGMAKQTLRTKACTHEIASHKNGKRLAFSRKDLDKYLEYTRRRSDAELRAIY